MVWGSLPPKLFLSKVSPKQDSFRLRSLAQLYSLPKVPPKQARFRLMKIALKRGVGCDAAEKEKAARDKIGILYAAI